MRVSVNARGCVGGVNANRPLAGREGTRAQTPGNGGAGAGRAADTQGRGPEFIHRRDGAGAETRVSGEWEGASELGRGSGGVGRFWMEVKSENGARKTPCHRFMVGFRAGFRVVNQQPELKAWTKSR